jgi:hypothetical protein
MGSSIAAFRLKPGAVGDNQRGGAFAAGIQGDMS